MAKDYAKKQLKKSATVPTWLWLVFGLLIGLIIASIVVYNYGILIADNVSKGKHISSKGNIHSSLSSSSNIPKPRFDFYTILPKNNNNPQLRANDNPMLQRPSQTQNLTTSHDNNCYYLQVASFKHFSEADRLKAELTLLGYSTHIENKHYNHQTWYRVRIGPFDDLKQANQESKHLAEQNYNNILVKN